MTDLTKYLTETIDFKIGERVCKCAPVSRLQFDTMIQKEKELQIGTAEFHEWQSGYIFEVLKAGAQGTPLTYEEFEAYPQNLIMYIYQLLAKSAWLVVADPN